jgi:hypothetical protein
MPDKAPPLNWPYVFAIIALSFGALGLIAWLVSTEGFVDLTPSMNRLAIASTDVLCLLALVALLNKIRSDANTILDDEGVRRPTLMGSRFLRWSDVREVRGHGLGLQLYGASTRMTITPYAYADPAAIIAFVEAKVSRLAAPSALR